MVSCIAIPGFGIGLMLASLNERGSVPFSSVFWKNICKIGIIFSRNNLMKLVCTWSFRCWKVFNSTLTVFNK